MFLGEYSHTVDAKGRLTIPARFRAELGLGLVITRGYQKCLAVYPQEEWLRLATKVAQMPSTSRETMAYNYLIFASASEATLDSAGRILIPAYLREYAGIENQVTIVGVNTHVEIWSPERWRETVARASENLEEILAAMTRMGL